MSCSGDICIFGGNVIYYLSAFRLLLYQASMQQAFIAFFGVLHKMIILGFCLFAAGQNAFGVVVEE